MKVTHCLWCHLVNEFACVCFVRDWQTKWNQPPLPLGKKWMWFGFSIIFKLAKKWGWQIRCTHWVGWRVGWESVLLVTGWVLWLSVRKIGVLASHQLKCSVGEWAAIEPLHLNHLTFCQKTQFLNFISSTIWDNFCHRSPKIKLISNCLSTLCLLSTTTKR